MSDADRDYLQVFAGGREFRAFDSVDVLHDLQRPSEALITIGDDGSDAIGELVRPGTPWKVLCGGKPRIVGFAEMVELEGTVERGAACGVTIRTKLSDASVTTADPKTKTQEGVTIFKFIQDLFYPLGYNPSDFIVSDEANSRSLMSGATKTSTVPRKDLESILPGQAKVQIGETVMEAAARHLERHGLIIWDAPDGRINIGMPDDGQEPQFLLRSKRERAKWPANNLLSYRKTRDWTGVPCEIALFGATVVTPAKYQENSVFIPGGSRSIKGRVRNAEIAASGTTAANRRMTMQVTGLRTSEQAAAKASQEMSRLRMRQDAWELSVDGWSYNDHGRYLPYASGHVCNVDCDLMGAPRGNYLIHRTTMSWNSQDGFSTTLSVVAKGIWQTELENLSLKDQLARVSGQGPA